ncbi:MAG TPA: hypothetical protein PLO89_03405, partial [Spirochaetota bacterium]|nr:hypothetical protein [Spirochaetota bacterium]
MKKSFFCFIGAIGVFFLLNLGCSLNSPFMAYELQQGGAGADVDLSNFYTKSEVNTLLLQIRNGNIANDASIDQFKIKGGKYGFVPFIDLSEDVNVKGFISANQFMGDGSKLTGLPTNPWRKTGTSLFYNDGNIGIGVENPLNKLEVNGIIDAKGLTINGVAVASSSDTFWVNNGGNISYANGRVG